MTRKEARELAFVLLFEKEFHPDVDIEELYRLACEQNDAKEDEYVTFAIRTAQEHAEEIDATIDTYAVGWKRTRISRVSLAVIRLAICEMFYMPRIPLLVSLNEAIELSKKYDDEKAYGFVNGVLNAAKGDPRVSEE